MARSQPDVQEPGIPQRVPWTTSRVTGSPEPPPPYRIERVFPKLQFERPVLLTTAPGSDRLFVAGQRGRLFSFRNDPECDAADVFLDLREEITTLEEGETLGEVYGLAFHPDFENNRYCYISYVLSGQGRGKQQPDGSRVSRFSVSADDPPRVDAASEQVLFTWLGGGHNGGCLKFGPDGYLYVATGDGSFPNPPDALLAGQDVSNLLSAILRIDVDRAEADRPYAVPADNPFVKLPGARPEIWAYGFRNPWKMSFDRVTGELWAGDVGWERFEMIHRIEGGGNYGWSVMEGTQPVRTETPPGPTPIVPPAIELPHSEAASITGGYVYRGRRHADLVGAYVFGDWETRRMWAARFDEGELVSMRELVEPTLRIVAFCEDAEGELLLVDYDEGTIHQFAKNEDVPPENEFPRRLSETGLFASVETHTPAPGVVPFSINAEQWADFATAERWIALPGTSSVIRHPQDVEIPGTIMKRRLEFPKDAVLVKTLSLEMRRGEPVSRRRMETQLLHFDGRNWRPYAYRWNEQGTDAVLVGAEGEDAVVTVDDPSQPGGKREQAWHFAGRAECARCHNPWAQHTLAFNLPQLARKHDYGHTVDDQLRALESVGILRPAEGGDAAAPTGPQPETRLVDPYNESEDLDARARSYLAANCAHCHQAVAAALSSALPPEADIAQAEIAAQLAAPPDAKLGDLALPCFPFARTLRRAPQQIASDIAQACEPGGLIADATSGGTLCQPHARPRPRGRRGSSGPCRWHGCRGQPARKSNGRVFATEYPQGVSRGAYAQRLPRRCAGAAAAGGWLRGCRCELSGRRRGTHREVSMVVPRPLVTLGA